MKLQLPATINFIAYFSRLRLPQSQKMRTNEKQRFSE